MNIASKFNYHYLIRQLLLRKCSVFNNPLELPRIQKSKLYFSIKQASLLNSFEHINYFYFFKFFFGRRAYLTRLGLDYTPGIKTLNFSVELEFSHDAFHKVMFFFAQDVFRTFGPDSFSNSLVETNTSKQNLFLVTISDVLLFSEKKPSIGLFELSKPAKGKFYLSNSSKDFSLLLFNALKYNTL